MFLISNCITKHNLEYNVYSVFCVKNKARVNSILGSGLERLETLTANLPFLKGDIKLKCS